jgi:hypothetical protein
MGLSTLNIEQLPDLKDFAYIDCQYFINEGGKGVTKNRLKFQYRTTHGESGKFYVPLSTNKQRNLSKKLIGIAGRKTGEELMRQYQDFKKQYDMVFVGFRQVELPSSDPEGKSVYRQDQFTICWVFLQGDQFLVHIGWDGQTLSMPPMIETSAKHERQSKLISYYHPQDDLAKQIAAKFGPKPMAEDDQQPRREGADACSGKRSAAVDWKRQAGSVGFAPQAQVDDATGLRPRIVPSVAVEEDAGELVDSDMWGVWRPDPATRTPIGLGTSIRF